MPRVIFVAPHAVAATVRFVRCAAAQREVRLGLVSHDPLEAFPADLAARVSQHWQLPDALDPDRLEEAVRSTAGRLGGVDRLIGVLEQLQVPLAVVRDRLGIPGMDAETARNFRDKSRMKTVLRAAGLPCARHRLAESADEAGGFAEEAGYPLIVKPPAGAGARATFRVDDADQLRQLLSGMPPAPGRPLLLEELVMGRERSFEAVALGGEVVWHSISHYRPTPLEVLRTPWIQWSIVLPRKLDQPAHQEIRALGPRALRALGLDTGLCHMEWFELEGGRLAISEVAARPPGAQLTSLTSLAHDFDLYDAWARLSVHGEFDPPRRAYAAGAVFLRGQGAGRRVVAVRGVEQAQRELGGMVMEAKLPRPGQPRSDTYEGEGYVLLRHPETEVVERGIARIFELLRVELGE
ncbi:MAG: ATP-grasp domain-containing protein [Thermoanaerobaculia bacterium]|nr:ATP-grasp domain-containing protein [Thermoanaerobaculia bacterium]